MRRVRSLGGVTFGLNSLFVKEEMSPASLQSSVRMSANGRRIVWVQEVATPTITLQSMRNGWITDDQREAIVAMYNDIGTVQTLIYDDGTTQEVLFAYEKPPQFTTLFEGVGYFTAEITVAKL